MKPIRAQRSGRYHQCGSTLFVSLILLVLMMMIVISIIKATNVNTKIAGNMQIQKEAEAAAQQAVESVVATDFINTPTATTVQVDVNQDGTADYSVAVPKPACMSVQPIKTTQLDITNSDDQGCFLSNQYQPGVSSAGNSLCSNSVWEIQGTASDLNGSSTSVTTHQGIGVRVTSGTTCP